MSPINPVSYRNSTYDLYPEEHSPQPVQKNPFFEEVASGAVYGDFGESTSWGSVLGQVGAGLIPGVGQAADVRDTGAAVTKIVRGEAGGWTDLGLATLGWIPLFGDGLKGALRVSAKVVDAGKSAGQTVIAKTASAVTDAIGQVSSKKATEVAEALPSPVSKLERPAPVELETPTIWGTHRGVSSNREFSPDQIGVPTRPLSTHNVRITEKGALVVKKHLSRFESDEANVEMLNRLDGILSGRIVPTTYDANFYTHELREFVRYRKLGYPDGEPPDSWEAFLLWNNTHTATLEDYGLTDADIYHPAINKNSE